MFDVDVARSAGWDGADIAGSARIGVRPEHLVRSAEGLTGSVYHVEHLGGQTLTHLRLENGVDFTLLEPGENQDGKGDSLTLVPAAGCLHAFDTAGRAIRN